MNKLIESTNKNQVLNESGITTEIITTDQEASNDGVMINGQPIMVDGITANYDIRECGLYYVESLDEGELDEGIKISAPIFVIKFIKNESTNDWSRQVLHKDFFGEWQKITISMGEISGNPKRLAQILANSGLQIEEDQTQQLYDYVISCKPTEPLIRVDKPGWYGNEYVMPECPEGVLDSRYIYPASSRSKNLFPTAGTLNGWKENVSSLCINNSRLVFAVSIAFSSPLLKPMGGMSCGFHFSAASSRGKTTTLKVAKSVFGSPDNIASWRTTDNALEATASDHNDGFLALDEFELFTNSNLSQVAKTLYMIANGEGKSRYKMGCDLKTWKLFYLSSGENSVRDVYARGNKTPNAGEEVRLIDISADAGTGFGIFNTVNSYRDGAAFADALNQNVELDYGNVGRAFIYELRRDKELHVSFAQNAKSEFLSTLNLVDVDPQVSRVAEKIAIVVAGGELATVMGLTGWPEGEATWAGEECFKSWLDMRGGNNAQEADVAVSTVQNKLIQFGHNKFIIGENPPPRGQYWGKKEGDDYFIFMHIFNDKICKDMNSRSVTSELVRQGHITQSTDGRNSITKRIDGKVVRCIHINGTLFGAITEENTLTNTTES
jgi:putative DNA primase/helicase